MIAKLKSTVLSLLPVLAFVLLVHFTMYQFSVETLIRFGIGTVILICGQVIFLMGLDNSIVPMGEFVGNSVSNQKQFYIFVVFGFIFGLLTTIAEPDLQVLAGKIAVAGFGIPKLAVLICCGVGVGALISVGLIRIVTKHSLNLILFIMYALVVILAIFVDGNVFSMCLDSGACTTGVVTSPFLLAMGIGVARVVSTNGKSNSEDSFGLIALSSVGPIIVMIVLSLIFVKSGNIEVFSGAVNSTPLWLETLKDVSFSLLPLFIAFFIFEVIFIKISKPAKKKLLLGSLITFVGFYLFLFGIEFGFSEMGTEFGKALSTVNKLPITIIVCGLLGFCVVFCEPSIRILAKQIEEVTNRNIRFTFVMIAIAISVVVSIILIVLQVTYDFSIWWLFGIIYGISFALMPFVSKLFTAIAFDSSGVATGTITVAFIFPIMAGLAGSTTSGFGTLGVMTMTPVLVMELLGLAYKFSIKAELKKSQKMLLKLSKTEDIFSNVNNLKIKHEQEFEGRLF